MNVFDRLDAGTDFEIDMTVELDNELFGMWNYVLVSERVLTFLDATTIIRSGIFRIAILLHDCCIAERLWKVLFALAILQTSLRRARAMKHVFGDYFVELGMFIAVWDLGRDECINLIDITDLVLILKKDKQVHVRKATFLIFNGVHQASNSSKVAFPDFVEQGLFLLIENTGNQVRSVSCRLT
jgi:hypothetical protein